MSITPDLGETRRFLRLLDPDPRAHFDFRTAASCGHDPRLSIMMRGTLDVGVRQSKNPAKNGKLCRPAGLFSFMQERGASAFAVVNPTDGLGQTDGNVTGIRMVFSDEDSAQAVQAATDFERRSGLTRSAVVESGGVDDGVPKAHSYWRLSGCPPNQFRMVQQLLCSRIGGDRAVVNPSRVMRLPGFWHLKGAPRMTRIVAESDAGYEFEDFLARVRAQPELYRPPDASVGPHGTGRATPQAAGTSRQAAEFQAHLERCGKLFSRAIPAAIAAAKQGERYLMLRTIIARLAAAGWGAADVRTVLLPHVLAAWTDTPADVLGRQVDSLAAWVLQREAEKTTGRMTERAARLAKAFGAGQ